MTNETARYSHLQKDRCGALMFVTSSVGLKHFAAVTFYHKGEDGPQAMLFC